MPKQHMYILFHIYPDSAENGTEEVKLLGVYSTEAAAIEARERYADMCGFERCPPDCFHIDRYTVDEDANFTDGFRSWTEST